MLSMPSSDQNAGGRYALYWSPPPGSILARLGAAWLGREAEPGPARPRPAIAGFDAARLEALTAAPRRYGLHATLKSPFALAQGMDLAMLRLALTAFGATRAQVILPALRVARLGRFIALTPAGACPALEALAAACVMHFDRFRAPPAPGELARRRAAGLSTLEESYLARWGYPYVLDRFRFHVTLTGSLDPAEAERLIPALAKLFEPATGAPVALADIALFHEPAAGAPFRLVVRFALRDLGTGQAS
jgi:putative phosphonate metabolism protein